MRQVENPFNYIDPIAPEGRTPFVSPPIVLEVVNDLIARRCCLVIGPPGSGTSTVLLAARTAYLDKSPDAQWWPIDLLSLPTHDVASLFRALAAEGLRRYPDQRSDWITMEDDSDFCRALIRSARATLHPLVLAIDHIENVPPAIAKTVIRNLRSLYINWDMTNLPPRMISAVVAGSHQLYRQAAERGSPLNFARSHHVHDLSPELTRQFLMSASAGQEWSFAPETVEYLTEMTNGDKYLLQRLGSACVEALSAQPDARVITYALAEKVVEDFVSSSFCNDAKLNLLMPALIEDEEAIEFVSKFLSDPEARADYWALVRAGYSAHVTRIFRIQDREVTIRNPVYLRILKTHLPLIEAARRVHEEASQQLRRLYKLQDLIAQAELASGSGQLMTRLLREIGNFDGGEDTVHLLGYEARTRSYKLETSSASDASIQFEVADEGGEIRQMLLKAEEAMPCQAVASMCLNCLGDRGNRCTWIPLNLDDATATQVGVLVLRGKPWALSNPHRRGMGDLYGALASTLQRRRQLRGLQRLVRVRVDGPMTNVMQTICDNAADTFNKPIVCLWSGQLRSSTLPLEAHCGADHDVAPLDLSVVVSPLREPNGPFINSYLLQLDQPSERSVTTVLDFMRSYNLASMLFIAFRFGMDNVGVLGIGCVDIWQPTEIETTLAQLAGEGAATFLGNLYTVREAEQRIESSRRSVYLLSHELRREPAKIYQEVEMLLEGINGPLTEKQSHALKRVQAGIDAHREVTERLLTISRLDAGTFHASLQRQLLAPIVEKALSDMAGEMVNAGMSYSFDVEGQPLVHSIDDTLIGLVIKNLVRNGMQHVGHGRIAVRIWSAEGRSYVAVQDQGSGIPSEYHRAIFERFNRGAYNDTRQSHPGNLGLGLYIVREIILLHHGTIAYDETYTQGARFILMFPPPDGGDEHAL